MSDHDDPHFSELGTCACICAACSAEDSSRVGWCICPGCDVSECMIHQSSLSNPADTT